MQQETKRIIWIDKNIKSVENQVFLEILKSGINNAKFYPIKTVYKAFNLIKNEIEIINLGNNIKEEIKVFQFKLFYVIVSGSLSNEFFNEYIKATKELAIISANIIFCADKDKHMRNAYYLDDFLNPGKVYNEKTIDKMIEYINRDEFPLLKEPSITQNKKIYIPQKENFGNIFFNADSISKMAYPYFFGQIMNSNLINDYDLEAFQNFLLDYYPKLKDLIFPAREKKIAIPYYLLAKFYLHMYTYESSNFFKNMNLDLSNDKFDLYRVYIFLLYDALNKKSLKPFYTNSLYRGAALSKKELDTINNLLNDKNKNNKNDGKINACLYFSKTFLSFSKNIDVAIGFLGKENNESFPVLFEIKGLNEKDMKNNDFFISNINLKNISQYNEEEVLFLPFSCFEIISIEDKIYKNTIYKKITLNYLYKYKYSLYKFYEEIKKKEKFDIFLKQIIKTDFNNEINDLINFGEGNEFIHFYKKVLKNIDSYSQAIFSYIPTSIQKVLSNNGNESLLVIFENDLKIIMIPTKTKILFKCLNNLENFVPIGELITLKYHKNDDIGLKMFNDNNKIKNNILNFDDFILHTIEFEISDIIYNYEIIKNEPLMIQIKNLGTEFFTCLVPFLPKILENSIPRAILKNVPIITSISKDEYFLSVKNMMADEDIYKSQTGYFLDQTISLNQDNINLPNKIREIDFKILLYKSVYPGVIIGKLAMGLEINVKDIYSKYFNEKDDFNNLILFSESLYSQYISKKFREYCIPTLCWKGVSKNAKSFAIELIENGYRKWLVINIKKWIRKIQDIGDNIVEYKGISKNPFKVSFILYEINKELSSPQEWGVGKDIKKTNIEGISQFFNQVAILDVF